MAHGGVNSVLRKGASIVCKAKNTCSGGQEGHGGGKPPTQGSGVGSRRIFAPLFKLQVLDSYRNDADCKGNQRATARKYGIHRRQIQKWLQVENTLRNSVAAKNNNNNKVTLISNNINQKSSSGAINTKSVAGTPLDFTTHCRSSPSVASISARPISSNTSSSPSPPHCQFDPSVPIDLSKKSAVGHFNNNNNNSNNNSNADPTITTTPATAYLPAATALLEDHVSPSHPLAYTSNGLTSAAPAQQLQTTPYRNDVASPSSLATNFDATNICWDLTTKNKRKLDNNNNNNSNNTNNDNPKKIKLFKPYLNDNGTEPDEHENKPATIVSSTSYLPLSLPILTNPSSPVSSTTSSSTSPLQPPTICSCSDSNCCYNNNNDADYTYTITELHPTGSKSYYYNNYLYNHHYNNQPTDCYYDEYQAHNGSLVKQQRQSYSLDFKLSAIDCYYQDSVCKGNQRAVANKYNVHRRQVQKWLKQAEELRLRNESLKQVQTVVR